MYAGLSKSFGLSICSIASRFYIEGVLITFLPPVEPDPWQLLIN